METPLPMYLAATACIPDKRAGICHCSRTISETRVSENVRFTTRGRVPSAMLVVQSALGLRRSQQPDRKAVSILGAKEPLVPHQAVITSVYAI